MRVLHIVGGDLNGGAARGAYFLHQALLNKEVESQLLVSQEEEINDSSLVQIESDASGYYQRLKRMSADQFPLKRYDVKTKGFSTGIIGYDIRKIDFYKIADIIHLHWINAGMVSIDMLSKLNKPIVWTIRDMWPMTGGCHYFGTCERYKSDCGCCPLLSSDSEDDLSRYIILKKKANFKNNIYPVAISNWVKDCAAASSLFRYSDVDMIPNCIDTDEFSPADKTKARKALSLPPDKKIISFGALNSIIDKRKGFNELMTALKLVDNKEQLFLLIFGANLSEEVSKLGIDNRFLGYVNDNHILSLAYSASDVFVAPSLEEAFGKTLAESLSCGTPVVSFNATGLKDIVDHKSCGYLANPFEPEDLASGINWVLANDNRVNLSVNARKKAVLNYSLSVVSEEYIELYKKALDNGNKVNFTYSLMTKDGSINDQDYRKLLEVLKTNIQNVRRCLLENKKLFLLIIKKFGLDSYFQSYDVQKYVFGDFYDKADYLVFWMYFIINKDYYSAWKLTITAYLKYKDTIFKKLADKTSRKLFQSVRDELYKSQGIIFSFDKKNLGALQKYLVQRKKTCVLFGAGSYGQRVIKVLNKYDIKTKLILDNQKQKWGTLLDGLKIISPDDISQDMFVIIASTWYKEISQQLVEKGLVLTKDFLIMGD